MEQVGGKFGAKTPVLFRKTVVFWVVAVAAIFAIGLSAWLAFEYRNTPLLGIYGFRQTQTALTSYWACRTGFRVAYWTPVGGYPWAIPFEFPIYQWIVSLIACPLGIDLDPVGRLVSYSFWLACLWPSWVVCKRLFNAQARIYFWTFAALFMSTPVYLHWGRSFMIESAALFFSLAYLAFSLEMILGRDRHVDATLTGLFLTLAILQKSTTVLPLLLFAAVYLWRAKDEVLRDRLASESLRKTVVAYAIPFIIGVAWLKFTDHAKMANALGAYLTSDALKGWNFGTIAARFSEALWIKVIWQRDIDGNAAGHFGALLILAGLSFAPRRRPVIAAGVLLFLMYYMVFENLLFVHEYYPFSNTVYLIFAIAVSIIALIEANPKLCALVFVAFVGVVAINLHGYFTGPRFAEDSMSYADNPVLEVGKFVREHTSPNDPLLVFGDEWNSQLPYYSQRKAFVVPLFFKAYLRPLESPERYLDRGQSAILICDSEREDQALVKMVADDYPKWPKAALQKCDVYLRKN